MNQFDHKASAWDDDPVKHARAQAVAAGIRAMVALRPSMRALELGCGTGQVGFSLRDEFAHLTLAHKSPGMLAVLRDKIAAAGIANVAPLHFELGAGEAPAGPYDVVFSLMTLHHIADSARALADLHALLAPGGSLCIADLDAEDGSFHGEGFDGHNGFERSTLAALAEAAGFCAVRFDTVFTMEKGARRYPLFLMVAERAAG